MNRPSLSELPVRNFVIAFTVVRPWYARNFRCVMIVPCRDHIQAEEHARTHAYERGGRAQIRDVQAVDQGSAYWVEYN